MSGRRGELSRLRNSLEAAIQRRAGRGHRRLEASKLSVTPTPREELAAEPEERAVTVPTSAPRPAERPKREVEGLAAQRELAAKASDLEELRSAVAGCEACGLCETRTQTVFSDGAVSSGVMFIGEAPGADEDAQGLPFVGRAGQFLTRIIEKGMGVKRSEVYIANVLKCRPPDNRDPKFEEKALCTAWLDRQIELVDPKVIVALGRHAAVHLTGKDLSMGRLRGQVHRVAGRPIVPTYHPSYLIRQEGSSGFVRTKKLVWEDIQLAMAEAGLG
ncbi:MAG: uracil-DNA glycosylase [Planctomycetes bacterium]|nr:uracil-DNA glycosylase [Planctomycetota bacterium]